MIVIPTTPAKISTAVIANVDDIVLFIFLFLLYRIMYFDILDLVSIILNKS